MKKRWYRLLGITERQIANWSNELRDDINIFKSKDGEIFTLVKLDWFESILMRYFIMCNNFKYHDGISLRKI